MAKKVKKSPKSRRLDASALTEEARQRELAKIWRAHAEFMQAGVEAKLDRLSCTVSALGEKSPSFWGRVRALFAAPSASRNELEW